MDGKLVVRGDAGFEPELRADIAGEGANGGGIGVGNDDLVGGGADPTLDKLKRESKSGFTVPMFDTGRLMAGALGGGASGGGNFVGKGEDFIILDNASVPPKPRLSSSGSLALGTKSLKNSKSSGDNASE